MRLKSDEHRCLIMALIRCKAYYDGKPLTEAWAGLGTLTEYKQAYESGYMHPLDGDITPRIVHWWLLTEKGAAIVRKWLDEGYGKSVKPFYELSRSQIRLSDFLPPQEVNE